MVKASKPCFIAGATGCKKPPAKLPCSSFKGPGACKAPCKFEMKNKKMPFQGWHCIGALALYTFKQNWLVLSYFDGYSVCTTCARSL